MAQVKITTLSKQFYRGISSPTTGLRSFLSAFSGKEQKKLFWALKDINLSVESGMFLGIIGENGAGKSTLLRIIANVYQPTSGTIKTNGRIIPIIGLHHGVKERLSMRDNIFLFGALLNIPQQEIRAKFDAIVEFTALNNYVDTKLYQFSYGMIARLIFAITIHAHPEILLIDEALSDVDLNYFERGHQSIKELTKNNGIAIFASHDKQIIEKCHKVLVLEKGRMVFLGTPKEALELYPLSLKNSPAYA